MRVCTPNKYIWGCGDFDCVHSVAQMSVLDEHWWKRCRCGCNLPAVHKPLLSAFHLSFVFVITPPPLPPSLALPTFFLPFSHRYFIDYIHMQQKNKYNTPEKKEEMNIEKNHKSACVCPMLYSLFFFPSMRGPPEVWHHSWIQLSLKHLQLKG